METLNPKVLQREIELLAEDSHRLIPQLRTQLKALRAEELQKVFFVGSGDSLFAGICVAIASRELFHIPAKAVPAFEFLAYPENVQSGTLVVVISASGNTPYAMQALANSHQRGATTVAITCNPKAKLCEYADLSLINELPEKEPSPGVRSYQAMLLALFALAIELAAKSNIKVSYLFRELDRMPNMIDQTVKALSKPGVEAVELIADASAWIVAGSGPNRGTALYAAAKFVESSGRLASGVDIDEWYHVERHLVAQDIPIILIAPLGNAKKRAIKIAETATHLKRPVYAVTENLDSWLLPNVRHIPIPEAPREAFSPLICGIFAPSIAGLAAERSGISLFPRRGDIMPESAVWTHGVKD